MSILVGRREFLAAGLAGGAVSTLPRTDAAIEELQAGIPRVRHSVFDARAKLDSYRRGVETMMQWSRNDPTDPRGWTFQAAIHGSLGEGPFFNKCKHGSKWFFPWHRAYLWFFEKIVRQASGDPDFTLPYWDWNNPGRDVLPAPFRDQTSVLFHKRRAELNTGVPLTNDTQTRLALDLTRTLQAPGFRNTLFKPGFGYNPRNGGKGAMENPPHDAVHNRVGEDMGDPRTAALDPIFWVHHVNIDRLWDVWLASGRSNPDDADWANNVDDGRRSPWSFFDENKTETDVTTAEFLYGGARLDYEYDNLQGNSRRCWPRLTYVELCGRTAR